MTMIDTIRQLRNMGWGFNMARAIAGVVHNRLHLGGFKR
jgi:hypothetical protein